MVKSMVLQRVRHDGKTEQQQCTSCVYLDAQMVKNLPAMQEPGFNPWVGKMPQRREWPATQVFLPREFHGQRRQAGNRQWCHKESDTTEQLTLLLWTYLVGQMVKNLPVM